MTRREFLRVSTSAAAAAPMVSRGRYKLFAQSSRTYSARAIELLGRAFEAELRQVVADDGGGAVEQGPSRRQRLT